MKTARLKEILPQSVILRENQYINLLPMETEAKLSKSHASKKQHKLPQSSSNLIANIHQARDQYTCFLNSIANSINCLKVGHNFQTVSLSKHRVMQQTQLNKHYVFILFLLPLSSVEHCIHISMLKGTHNQPEQAAQNYKTWWCLVVVAGLERAASTD